MKSIKVKKFVLDYLIACIVIVVVFYGAIGNLTVMDTKGVLTLVEKCSSADLPQDILISVEPALRSGEQCELVTPCEGFQRLRCEGTAKVSDIPKHLLAGELLIFRVKRQLNGQYGVAGYSDKSSFRAPFQLIAFLAVYLLVLIEAGAILFALWRQQALRQTFALPAGSKTHQLSASLLLGVLLAVGVIFINFLVSRFFEYPDPDQLQANLSYFQTPAGIVSAILVAPFLEELIFRGVLLRLFVERARQFIGLVLVSLVFAAIHVLWEQYFGWQLYRFILYFLVSAILCWSYIRQKTLWSPIVLHGSYNAVMVAILNIPG